MTWRRRPVPREWREKNHHLRLTTHIGGGGWGGHARVYRSRGYCACGAEWPGPGADNLQADDVRDRWLDHVEEMYYATKEEG